MYIYLLFSANTRAHACKNTRTNTHARIHKNIHAQIQKHTHTQTHKHKHTQSHTHINTNTRKKHTHKHARTNTQNMHAHPQTHTITHTHTVRLYLKTVWGSARSYDWSKASSKAISLGSATKCFLFQLPESTRFLKFIQYFLMSSSSSSHPFYLNFNMYQKSVPTLCDQSGCPAFTWSHVERCFPPWLYVNLHYSHRRSSGSSAPKYSDIIEPEISRTNRPIIQAYRPAFPKFCPS
jgi:hypothetical protein